MYISSLIKVLGGFSFVSWSFVLVSYILGKDSLEIISSGSVDGEINIYGISEAITNAEKTEINAHNKNYVCKFETKYYECTISAVKDFDSNKKHLDIKDLKINKENHAINNYSLKQSGFIYRIKINGAVGNSMSQDKKIEVIKNAQDNGSKYASIKFLFALNADDSIHESTKTEYFIINTKNQSISVAAKSQLLCRNSPSWNERTSGSTRPCEVYEFSDQTINKNSSLSDFRFKPFTAGTSDEMKINKYYLINLKRQATANWAKCIELSKINNKQRFGVTTFLKNIIPAIYISEKPDNIFVLDKL